MHVDITRSTGLYRAGTTVELDDVDAQLLIDQGKARPRRLEAPARNASRDDWAEYAGKLGLEVADDDGRDAIITLVDNANPTGPPTT